MGTRRRRSRSCWSSSRRGRTTPVFEIGGEFGTLLLHLNLRGFYYFNCVSHSNSSLPDRTRREEKKWSIDVCIDSTLSTRGHPGLTRSRRSCLLSRWVSELDRTQCTRHGAGSGEPYHYRVWSRLIVAESIRFSRAKSSPRLAPCLAPCDLRRLWRGAKGSKFPGS